MKEFNKCQSKYVKEMKNSHDYVICSSFFLLFNRDIRSGKSVSWFNHKNQTDLSVKSQLMQKKNIISAFGAHF